MNKTVLWQIKNNNPKTSADNLLKCKKKVGHCLRVSCIYKKNTVYRSHTRKHCVNVCVWYLVVFSLVISVKLRTLRVSAAILHINEKKKWKKTNIFIFHPFRHLWCFIITENFAPKLFGKFSPFTRKLVFEGKKCYNYNQSRYIATMACKNAVCVCLVWPHFLQIYWIDSKTFSALVLYEMYLQ